MSFDINAEKKPPQHCCHSMDQVLEEVRSGIIYVPMFREYAVHAKYFSAGKLITFCAWCGNRLPKPLRQEYFDILRDEYHLQSVTLHTFALAPDIIPEEFKSDLWWKKRGL